MYRSGEKVVLGLEVLEEVSEKLASRRLAQHGVVDLSRNTQ